MPVSNPKKSFHHAFRINYQNLAHALVSEVKIINFINKSSGVFRAIWDTGATCSAITKSVVEKLGLEPTGMAHVVGVNGESDKPTYLVDLILPQDVGIKDVNVTECILPKIDILIGMDVICIGDFSISNYGGKTTFCFSIPAHPNPIDLVEKAIRSNKKR